MKSIALFVLSLALVPCGQAQFPGEEIGISRVGSGRFAYRADPPGALAGLWEVDSEATAKAWPMARHSRGVEQVEFAVTDKKLVLVLPDKRQILAGSYWQQGIARGAQFKYSMGKAAQSKASQCCDDCVFIGEGSSMILILQRLGPGEKTSSLLLKKKGRTNNRNSSGGYWTTIEEATDDVVKLTNGAVVEVVGYIGYVGYGKRALLHANGRKLWVEGKKDYLVVTLKAPVWGRKVEVLEKSIRTAADDGSLFLFSDGSRFDPYFPTFVGAFSEFSNCYVVSGSSLLFDDGDLIESGSYLLR